MIPSLTCFPRYQACPTMHTGGACFNRRHPEVRGPTLKSRGARSDHTLAALSLSAPFPSTENQCGDAHGAPTGTFFVRGWGSTHRGPALLTAPQTASPAEIGGAQQVLGPALWSRIYFAWIPRLVWCVTAAGRQSGILGAEKSCLAQGEVCFEGV